MHTSVEKIVGLLKDYGLENALACSLPRNDTRERATKNRRGILSPAILEERLTPVVSGKTKRESEELSRKT
jgi:hypothetical protein